MDLKSKAENLIKASNIAGGRDNISVILIAVSA
jgi:serine/threonine protein phosphatase PrpC